ncbi:actin-interacting protein 1-like [Antedon mediterranea]|uniref:actin-interacting protein 1-like n=1 Tax=Antedon mediterranea TaxID=105859 RepID=UPI003AF729FF
MSVTLRSLYAALPRTERAKSMKLGGDPKGKNFLYCNGNSVFIRDIENPTLCDIYSQHSKDTTVAAYSPSGFYIASADISGKVRIWDTTQKEHILKNEYQPISGQITDIAWSDDSKRLAITGAGKQSFAAVFLADTGTTVGTINCHSSVTNSIAYRPTRPFRIVTASDDRTAGMFEGPPFKYKKVLEDHAGFVNIVRYSSDGKIFATGSSDRKVFLYEGKDGMLLHPLGGEGTEVHSGGVMSLAWSPDNTQLLTVSADKTAKLWDVSENKLVAEHFFGNDVGNQQLGCLWQGQHILSVSLSGDISYLDFSSPSKVIRTLKGHQKTITAMTLSNDKSTLFSGSFDNRIRSWSRDSGECEEIVGNAHKNQINRMIAIENKIVTAAMDDTVKSFDSNSKQFTDESFGTNGVPKGLSCIGDLTVVATVNEVTLLRNGKKVFSQPEKCESYSASIHPGKTEVAVGRQDNKVFIYKIEGDTLVKSSELEAKGSVNDVCYSPDGAYLAAVNSNKTVNVHKVDESYMLLPNRWTHHTASVMRVDWSPDSRYLATVGLDTNIIIWSIENPSNPILRQRAHGTGAINSIVWLSENTIATAGADSCLKEWTIEHA